MANMENPAGRATGGAIECLADIQKDSTFPSENKHLLRLSRLQRWHGLSGSRAALIADLVRGGRPTPKQADWIDALLEKTGGYWI